MRHLPRGAATASSSAPASSLRRNGQWTFTAETGLRRLSPRSRAHAPSRPRPAHGRNRHHANMPAQQPACSLSTYASCPYPGSGRALKSGCVLPAAVPSLEAARSQRSWQRDLACSNAPRVLRPLLTAGGASKWEWRALSEPDPSGSLPGVPATPQPDGRRQRPRARGRACLIEAVGCGGSAGRQWRRLPSERRPHHVCQGCPTALAVAANRSTTKARAANLAPLPLC